MSLTVFDGCIEVLQQAPLLEIYSIQLCWMNSLPPIPKIFVRHTRLQTLKLFQFPFELLCGFLEVLELPSLQAYHLQAPNDDIAVDNVISLLNHSGVDLKQLTLDVHQPQLEDIKKLLNAVPSLQILHLNFCCAANGPVIRELFEHLFSSMPIGDISGFLPTLRCLTISGWKISIWECTPCLFSSPHRKLLRLEVNKRSDIKIEKDTLRTILRLVDEGFNIRIFEGRCS